MRKLVETLKRGNSAIVAKNLDKTFARLNHYSFAQPTSSSSLYDHDISLPIVWPLDIHLIIFIPRSIDWSPSAAADLKASLQKALTQVLHNQRSTRLELQKHPHCHHHHHDHDDHHDHDHHHHDQGGNNGWFNSQAGTVETILYLLDDVDMPTTPAKKTSRELSGWDRLRRRRMELYADICFNSPF